MNWLTFLLLIPAALVVIVVLAIVLELRVSFEGTKELRNAVKQRFFPYLESKGFERKSNSMCTTFRRVTVERVHIVELRWDKYGKPCFSIGFGEVPNATLHLPAGSVLPSEIEICYAETLGYLNRKNGAGFFGMDGWFQLRKPLPNRFFTRKREYTPDEVIDQLLEKFQEIENWFATKQVGKHIRMSRLASQRAQ